MIPCVSVFLRGIKMLKMATGRTEEVVVLLLALQHLNCFCKVFAIVGATLLFMYVSLLGGTSNLESCQ